MTGRRQTRDASLERPADAMTMIADFACWACRRRVAGHPRGSAVPDLYPSFFTFFIFQTTQYVSVTLNDLERRNRRYFALFFRIRMIWWSIMSK